MNHRSGFFHSGTGQRIFRQVWSPEKASRASVVIVHGLGEHSGRYAHVAARLVEAGLTVHALDHRGHGESEGERAFVDRFSNAVADIDHLVDFARTMLRGKPLFMVGHSMGGALALSYTLKHGTKLAGLVLSAPAIALDGAPPMVKPIAKMLSTIAPKLGLFAIDPSLVSRDPSVAADYAADPLNAHGKVPARTLAELVKFVEWAPAALPVIQLPVLVLHGEDDQLAGVAGSRMIVERVSSTDKTLKVYPKLYHEIFNELPEDRAQVLADLAGWLIERADGKRGATAAVRSRKVAT